jgi:hypothetical protein
MQCEPLGMNVPEIENYQELCIILYHERYAKSQKHFFFGIICAIITNRIAIWLQKEVTIRTKFENRGLQKSFFL